MFRGAELKGRGFPCVLWVRKLLVILLKKAGAAVASQYTVRTRGARAHPQDLEIQKSGRSGRSLGAELGPPHAGSGVKPG